MVFYVAYRAPQECKGRSIIPHRLKALGCERVHRSFWEVEEESVNRVLKGLEKNHPILLRRVREIKKPRFAKNNGIPDLGSLIIIAYATPREVKREKTKNFLRKAPCIRLCRSVYAFSQNHTLFDKKDELVDALKFEDFIKVIEEDVKVIPRVVVADRNSVEMLLEEIRQQIESDVSDIIMCCRELYDRALEGEHDIQRIQDLLSKNRRRFVTLKKVAVFYEKWLRMDFSRSLMRAYRAVEKVNAIVSGN